MKFGISFVVLIAFVYGCSSATSPAGVSNDVRPSVAASTAVSPTPSPSPVSPSSALGPTPSGVPSASTQASSSNSKSTELTGRLDRMARQRRSPTQPGGAAPLEFRVASENSSTATTMNAAGQVVEVRVFKNNPKLARVEATWIGPREKLVKFMSADGATSEVRTTKLKDLRSASTAVLLRLAKAAK